MTDLVANLPSVPLPNRRLAAGTLASIVVHGLLIAALLVLSPLRQLVVPAPPPVSVEIVTETQFKAIVVPVPAQSQTPEITTPNGQEATETPPSYQAPAIADAPASTILGVHIATKSYAGDILNQPGMERIRKTMETIAPSERLVQLCNIEGIEQLKRAAPEYAPDTIVAYAMSDPLVAGLTLSAPGAAFRSRRRWFGVAFKCTAAADLTSVTTFEFKVGRPIPQSEWDAHNLNAEDSDE